jgi:hypothetical protein
MTVTGHSYVAGGVKVSASHAEYPVVKTHLVRFYNYYFVCVFSFVL